MSSSNTIKIAGIIEESIVDGPGIRFVIFTQGCPHNCFGCHNPQTHDINGGMEVEIDNIIKKISENPLLKGVTLSGGEPFMQANKIAVLLDKIDRNKLNVITYTGFKYEYLIHNSNAENGFMELLNRTDILIDGKFEIENKDENLKFMGSSNQRAIDVRKSLELDKIVEHIF